MSQQKLIEIVGYDYEVSVLKDGQWVRYFLAGNNPVASQVEPSYRRPIQWYWASKNEIRWIEK